MYFMQSHEWARAEGDEILIGLSAFAAGEVGEVIHVELPALGTRVERGEPLAEIESVKSVNDFYAPVAGEVVAINPRLAEAPELVNEAPQGEGWFVRLRASQDEPFSGLLDETAYQQHISG